jgi:hypothetical protein
LLQDERERKETLELKQGQDECVKVGKQQVKKSRFAEALFNRNKTCISRAQ